MAIFSKPKVTQREFKKKVRTELYDSGIPARKLNQLEGFLRGDLEGSTIVRRGIDSRELENSVKWLKENPGKHQFSSDQVERIEKSLRKNL